MRLLRLGLAILMSVQAFKSHDWLLGLMGVFFLYQALSNTGCCSSAGCDIPPKKNNPENEEQLIYEEVKNQ